MSPALQAADAYREAGDDVRAGMAELTAARIVAKQGQTGEAIALLRSAIEATIAAGAGAHAVDSFLVLAELLANTPKWRARRKPRSCAATDREHPSRPSADGRS